MMLATASKDSLVRTLDFRSGGIISTIAIPNKSKL